MRIHAEADAVTEIGTIAMDGNFRDPSYSLSKTGRQVAFTISATAKQYSRWGGTICHLPQGFRPTVGLVVPAVYANTGIYAIWVGTDGNVTHTGEITQGTILNFTISFHV